MTEKLFTGTLNHNQNKNKQGPGTSTMRTKIFSYLRVKQKWEITKIRYKRNIERTSKVNQMSKGCRPRSSLIRVCTVCHCVHLLEVLSFGRPLCFNFWCLKVKTFIYGALFCIDAQHTTTYQVDAKW